MKTDYRVKEFLFMLSKHISLNLVRSYFSGKGFQISGKRFEEKSIKVGKIAVSD